MNLSRFRLPRFRFLFAVGAVVALGACQLPKDVDAPHGEALTFRYLASVDEFVRVDEVHWASSLDGDLTGELCGDPANQGIESPCAVARDSMFEGERLMVVALAYSGCEKEGNIAGIFWDEPDLGRVPIEVVHVHVLKSDAAVEQKAQPCFFQGPKSYETFLLAVTGTGEAEALNLDIGRYAPAPLPDPRVSGQDIPVTPRG